MKKWDGEVKEKSVGHTFICAWRAAAALSHVSARAAALTTLGNTE